MIEWVNAMEKRKSQGCGQDNVGQDKPHSKDGV